MRASLLRRDLITARVEDLSVETQIYTTPTSVGSCLAFRICSPVAFLAPKRVAPPTAHIP